MTGKNNTLLGSFYLALAILIFNIVNVIVKNKASFYPIGELLFIRNFFSLLTAAAMLFLFKPREVLKTSRMGTHMIRGLVGNLGVLFIFWSLHLLPLAEASVCSFTSSLFITVLSALFLKEVVGLHRWVAVVVGFCGVLFIKPLHPEMILQFGILVALTGALLDAGGMTLARVLAPTDHVAGTSFYYALYGFVFSALALPFGWVSPTLVDIGFIAILGIGGGLAQFFIAKAYAHAEASAIAPIIYTGLVWAILFDFLFWGVLPTTSLFIGAGVVITCALYNIYAEKGPRKGLFQNFLSKKSF